MLSGTDSRNHDDQDRPADAERGTARDGDGTERRYTVVSWRPGGQRQKKAGGWYYVTLSLAFLLLIALAAGTMYVSYEAQVAYVQEHKGTAENMQLAVHLEAIAWDAAALIFGLLGLATAMSGRSALRARLGNLVCIGVSVAMNAAPVWDGTGTDPGALLVWAGPPLLYAAASDTVILEIQQRACPSTPGHSIWSLLGAVVGGIGTAMGWVLLMILDIKRAPAAWRKWFIDHFNYAPARSAADDLAEEAQRQALEAGDMAEQVKAASAEAIAAAEQRAAEQVAAERERHAAALQEAQEAAEQLLAEKEETYTAALEELRQRLAEVDRRSSEGLAAAEQRREADLAEQAEEYRRQVADLLAQVEKTRGETERARAEARRLQGELEISRGVLSLRQQVELGYAELGRAGDPRYGRYEAIDEVAEELQERLGDAEGRTVRRYLRETVTALAESGQQDAAAASEARVTRVNGSMIGGA